MRLKQKTSFTILVITFFLSTYGYLFVFYINHQDVAIVPAKITTEEVSAKATEKVVRVVDGDTFEIEGGIKVRLIGVDTPEMKNKNKTVDCFASESTKRLNSLISGKEVVLEKDVSDTDRYGRLLRYVYLENEFINDILVKEGYARVATFPPDVRNTDLFLKSEKSARELKLGLWSACAK